MQVGEFGHERRFSLASPARAIQRKRIHSLSTGCRLVFTGVALVAASCSSPSSGPSGAFALSVDFSMPECDPASATCQVEPNTQETLRFTLTQGGRPAPGQNVTFSLAPPSAGGATLATPSGVTDFDGKVAATIHTGVAADFVVVGQAGQTTGRVAIVVDSGSGGSVLVAPFFAPSSTPPPEGATMKVLFYDLLSCSDLNLDHPIDPQRPVQTPLIGQTAVFQYVYTNVMNAAIAQVSTDRVIAQGCIDIPGSSVQPGGTVQVSLPLYDAMPDPLGTYSVTTDLLFPTPLEAAAALAAPWTDLSDCPLDPAQRWLDVTVNALSPTTSADPLTLGQVIAARRGVPLVDGSGSPTSCRSARDSGSHESLDALVLGLFGSPLPAPVAALPAIADDAASLLDSVRLLSTLAVAASSTGTSYVVTHTLTTARLGPQAATVSLAALGLPTLQAFAPATAADGVLSIGQHAFTLRLGTVARAAFGPLSLAPRGLPADLPSFVAALFALAQSPDGTATGCAALDGVVCPAIGDAGGCLISACQAGLEALATDLADGFATADGTGLDLSLSGSAPLTDESAGLAERLGSDQKGAAEIAIWSVNLRTALGSDQLTASFSGTRNRN
jgi:hypothetical protein